MLLYTALAARSEGQHHAILLLSSTSVDAYLCTTSIPVQVVAEFLKNYNPITRNLFYQLNCNWRECFYYVLQISGFVN